jgi:hypothetical protein
MKSPELAVDGITLYGKLRELKDRSRGEDESGYFWGELIEENGQKWRIRFRDSEQKKVLNLFRKQVTIVGDVTYFKTQAARVDVSQIDEDSFPDYLAAFNHFGETYEDVFQNSTAEDILNNIRE